MKRLLLISNLVLCLFSLPANAQTYCIPDFINGCFNWQTQSIICNNLTWYSTGVCEDNDFTSDTLKLAAGVPALMDITNANWCGSSIWVDFNNDLDFDDAGENLFGQYLANEINTYSFPLTIPSNTPEGNYRFRVITSWGSDGITPGGNGDGGCGFYQYGNFGDFTLNVAITNSIPDRNSAVFSISPNPAEGYFIVNNESGTYKMTVFDIAGKTVMTGNIESGRNTFDISTLAGGVYTVRIGNSSSKLIIN